MAIKVTRPQIDLREEINKALTLRGLENQLITVNGLVSNGKVGIGTDTPGAKLHVVASGADGIVLDQDTSSTNNSSRLFFNSTSGNWAVFNNSGMLNLQSGAAAGSTSGNYTDFQLTTSQVICRRPFTVVNNNLNISSGYGINFSATTDAAGMSSEVLDDYEEGTWTPTIFGGTTAGTYVLESARTGGVYTRIGNMVTITAVLRITSITSAGTGTLNFGGLPFGFGPNMALAWGQGGGIHVEHYGAGVNSSASTYPPPFVGIANSVGGTSFTTNSFGKNYQVSSVIGDLTAVNWIYIISGTYQTAS